MSEGRRVATTTSRTEEPAKPLHLPFDPALELPPPPAPLPPLNAGERIREALRRWLEEDM